MNLNTRAARLGSRRTHRLARMKPRVIEGLFSMLICCAFALPAKAGGFVPGCTENDFINTLAGGGEVAFGSNCSLTLTAPITITNNTTIDGGGFSVTINGGTNSRLFTVASGITLNLTGLTLSGGLSTNGGAIYVNSNALVRISNSTLMNNRATGITGSDGEDGAESTGGNGGNGTRGEPGRDAFGGAIFNQGQLILETCRFLTNIVTGGTGGNGGTGGDGVLNSGNGGAGASGAAAAGGAVYNLGVVSVVDCTFMANSAVGGDGGEGGDRGAGLFAGLAGIGAAGGAAHGAAVYSANTIEVEGCTFAFNTARAGASGAGGMRENGNGSAGPNGANSFGGAIYTAGTGTMVNTTLYSNQAVGGSGGHGGNGELNAGNGGNGGNATGGAIYNLGAVAVTNCTLEGSSAIPGTNGLAGTGAFPGEAGSRGRGRGGNAANADGGTFVLLNSILGTSASGGAAFGAFTDQGHNLSVDKSIVLGGVGSFVNTNALLGVFQDNGGLTQTMTLLSGSPAIDTGDNSAGLDQDQRGFIRPGSGNTNIDIGAVEGQAPEITVSPASQTRAIGGTASFSLTVTGERPLTYFWRHGSEVLTNATNATLSISGVTTAHQGAYDVIVTNAFGQATSAVAILTVVLSPTITSQPQSQTVLAGTNVSFQITASGTEPLSYRWRFNTTNSLTGANTSSLVLTNVQAANAGRYSVIVTNAGGTATSLDAVLTVFPATTLTAVSLRNQEVGFSFLSQTNITYVLESKNALDDPEWIPESTNTGNGLFMEKIVPVTNSLSRFYRLRLR